MRPDEIVSFKRIDVLAMEWRDMNRENDSDENTPDTLMFVNSIFVINGLHRDEASRMS